MKSFISKYKQNQIQSSQSSIAQLCSQSTTGYSSNNQNEKIQNSQNQYQNVNSQLGSQQFQSQNQLHFIFQFYNQGIMNSQTQDDNRNQFMNNNSFKPSQKPQTQNFQLNQSYIKMHPSQDKSSNNPSFLSQESVQSQNYSNFNNPYPNFQQSVLVLPPISESTNSYGGNSNFQQFNLVEQKNQKNNLDLNQINLQQNAQKPQINNPQVKILYDEIQKEKQEQQDLENQLKIELLSEIKEIKTYFMENIMSEVDDQFMQREQTLMKYSQHLDELLIKVEKIVKSVFKYLQDPKTYNTKKNKIRQSEYAQIISDLYEFVSEIKQNVNQQSDVVSNSLISDLNLATNFIFSKINQAKKSVKKQFVCSITKPPKKRGRKPKVIINIVNHNHSQIQNQSQEEMIDF